MKTHYETKYKCGSCQRLHEDEDDAEDCCRPTVDEVYVCTGCEQGFDVEKQAMAHVREKAEPPQCLCGNVLQYGDYEESQLIGALAWCANCREMILSGVPAMEARDKSFMRRAGLVA